MSISNFSIGNKIIGVNNPCFIIAEVGLAHDGSLGAAYSFIDASAASGVDAVKFQTHIASAESSVREGFRVNVFPQDKNRYAYWERTSFTKSQWKNLKEYAEDKNLKFLSTPFSNEAVILLREIGLNTWKIGSGDINNLLLLEEIAEKPDPVLLSSGMSYLSEIDESVQFLQSRGCPVMVMQCTTSYPCPPENYGLDMINEFQERYKLPVGYSDHSGEIAPGLAAVTLGANAVEVHVTWDKQCFGPDVKASLTFSQLSELVKGIRLIESSLRLKTNKDQIASEFNPLRKLFTKGLFAQRDIESGHILSKKDIVSLKPCEGISVKEYHKIVGKKVKHNIPSGQPITWADLE